MCIHTFDFHKLNYVTGNGHHRRTVTLNLQLMATAPAVCLGLDSHHEKLAAVPREVLTTIMSTAASSSISVSPSICAILRWRCLWNLHRKLFHYIFFQESNNDTQTKTLQSTLQWGSLDILRIICTLSSAQVVQNFFDEKFNNAFTTQTFYLFVALLSQLAECWGVWSNQWE